MKFVLILMLLGGADHEVRQIHSIEFSTRRHAVNWRCAIFS